MTDTNNGANLERRNCQYRQLIQRVNFKDLSDDSTVTTNQWNAQKTKQEELTTAHIPGALVLLQQSAHLNRPELQKEAHILPRSALWVNKMAASTVSRVGDLASSSNDAENPSIRTLLSSPCNSGEVYLEIMVIALVSSRELCFFARLSSSNGYAGCDCSKKIDCTTAASGSIDRT